MSEFKIEVDENRGVAFFNKGCLENEKQPRYKGKINFGGEIKDLAVWVGKTKADKNYISIRVSDEFVPETQADNASEGSSEGKKEPLPF